MDEIQLISLARDGDEGALGELYRREVRGAWRTAFLMTGDRSLAEDVVQESFVQVVRRLPTLRDSARFRSWFYRILANNAAAACRKAFWRRWLPFSQGDADRPDPLSETAHEGIELQEEAAGLRAAIRQLKPAHRIPLVLHYFAGLPEEEIARVLDCPVGTVKSRMYHARRTLHRWLAPAAADLINGKGCIEVDG